MGDHRRRMTDIHRVSWHVCFVRLATSRRAMSGVGQTRKSVAATAESALPPGTDIVSLATQVPKAPDSDLGSPIQSTRRRGRAASAAQ
jgi:hypothetical protein